MAINLDKKEKKNSCLIPFLVVLVIIAALVAGIGLLWGVTGYIWFLRILGVIFAFVAFCGLSSASGVGCLITIICGIFANINIVDTFEGVQSLNVLLLNSFESNETEIIAFN